MLMVPMMVAKLSRGVIFGRLLRPHPRVLGISVCASTTDVSSPDLVPGPHALQLLPRLLCLRTTVLHIFLSSLILSFDSFNY